MTDLPLTLACWDYDRTRPLIDGRVQPDGIALDVRIMRPRVAFDRMLATGEFHVSEMSFANYASLKAAGSYPLVAIPVMISKMFRHDCFYVNSNSGIEHPAQLAGRRVGTMRYSSTALVYARGLLSDDYGLREADLKWVIGGINAPQPSSRPASAHADVSISVLSGDATLDRMLVAGEIDALISQDLPQSFLAGDPRVKRLFADPKAAQLDYFKRTAIFPIMHVVAIRRDVYEGAPWVASALYKAFCQAKDIAVHGLYDTDALHLSLPFLISNIEEVTAAFGPDFFAYGVEANRPAIAALTRYLGEQGLAQRPVTPDELFVAV